MTLKMPLVSITEIAQRAGVQKPVICVWRNRHEDFPDSVADLRVGSIYWWPDVEKGLLRHGRNTNETLTVEQVNAASGSKTRNERKTKEGK